ncbi:MAG: hypothetical protein R2773_04920 [Flavobacteriaceae bacterium]
MQPILRIKILQLALALSALFGYLEWGEGQHQFLFQTLVTLFSKGWQDPVSVAHPLTILPFIGLLFLGLPLLQRHPSKRLTYFGMVLLGLLMALLLVIGILGAWKTLVSVIPFWALTVFTIKAHRKGY